MKTLFNKELREQWRTWRFMAMVGVLAVSGLMSPLLAYYTPALLRMVPDIPAAIAGMIPPPSMADAVAQYVKNVSQFGVLLVVILTMGAIAGEVERGTAAMLLVRPVSRSGLVIAKWLVWVATLALGLLISALACLAYTALLFGMLPVGPFALLNLLLLAFLTVYLSIALLASALVRSQGAASGLAFGGMALLLILSSLPRIGEFMPGQLATWGAALVLGQPPATWPALGVAVVIIIASLVGACLRLEREEI